MIRFDHAGPGENATMEPSGEFQIALFSALFSQLSRTQKQWLAMQLAQMLTIRLTSESKLGINHSPAEAPAIATRVLKDLGRASGRTRQRFNGSSGAAKTTSSANGSDEREAVEAAKAAIHDTFHSWRELGPGGHWHVGFARIMARRHACLGQQDTIEEWARQWEKEATPGASYPQSQ